MSAAKAGIYIKVLQTDGRTDRQAESPIDRQTDRLSTDRRRDRSDPCLWVSLEGMFPKDSFYSLSFFKQGVIV